MSCATMATSKVTRRYCPGPWHDCIAAMYRDYGKIAPHMGRNHVAKVFGLFGWQVELIVGWCNDKKRNRPCPV